MNYGVVVTLQCDTLRGGVVPLIDSIPRGGLEGGVLRSLCRGWST